MMEKIISNIKKIWYRIKGYKIDKNVFIGYKSTISGNEVHISQDTYIDRNVQIIAKKIDIGKNCIIYEDTTLYCINNLIMGNRNKISRNCIIRANNFVSKEELWCNENVEIGGGGWKKNTANIEIGPYTHIGKNSHLNVCSPITIKGYSGIGMNTMMFTHSAGHGQSILKGYSYTQGEIVIEENVSIFSRCIITPNSYINKGVTIGANSFVKGILDEKSFYAGSPAKKIKQINDLTDNEKENKIREFLLEISEESLKNEKNDIYKINNYFALYTNELNLDVIKSIKTSNLEIKCIICMKNKVDSLEENIVIIDLSKETISGKTNDESENIRDNFRRVGIILKPLNYEFKKLDARKFKKLMIEI